jgi:hypothetical protein
MREILLRAQYLQFKNPFTCIISGPRGSGKSSFCICLLQHLNTLCTKQNFRGGIVWCYSEKSAVPTHEFGNKLRYHEGVPTDFGNATGGLPSLVILDDHLNEVYSREVCDLFTKGSHHPNLSVILITQNLFQQGKHCRDISLKAKYLVLLKNVLYKNRFLNLARQAYPEHPENLYNAYLDATQRPHGYVILDFAQNTDNLLGYRTNVFPTDYTVVYAPLNDETDTVKLSRSSSTRANRTKTSKSNKK